MSRELTSKLRIYRIYLSVKNIPTQKLPKQSNIVHFLDTKLLEEYSPFIIFVDIFLSTGKKKITRDPQNPR